MKQFNTFFFVLVQKKIHSEKTNIYASIKRYEVRSIKAKKTTLAHRLNEMKSIGSE